MPDEYTIQTTHSAASGDPADVWLETTTDAQARAILRESTRPTAASIHVSPLLVVDSKDAVSYIPAHFSARPSVMHIIPLRLTPGTTRIELLLTGELYARDDYDGTPTVTLTARIAGEPISASATVTGSTAMPVDLSWNIPPVALERVVDVWVELSSSAGATPYAEDSTGLETAPGGFGSIFGTSLGQTYGADTLIRYDANAHSTAPIGPSSALIANSADSMSSSRGPDHNILVYDSAGLPPGRVAVQLFSLTGWLPRSLRVGTSQGALSSGQLAERLTGFRANIPDRGALAGQVNLGARNAQNAPRLLLALPDGDELNEDDEVFEPRKWRVASSGSRTLLQTTIEPRRDYGQLEVQLRLVILDGSTYATAPETLAEGFETWEAPEDNALVGASLLQLFTGDVPDINPFPAEFSGGSLRVFPAVRGSTRWPVLRDLGRYAQGRANQRLLGVSRFESGAGFRDGLMLPEEAAQLVNVLAFKIPLDSVSSDVPLCIALQLDPDDSAGFWTAFPGALVAVVGASIIWDGRT